MSEERTRDLPDNRSFEERVFARFDAMEARSEARFEAIDARFEAMEARFEAMEARFDARFNAIDKRLDNLDSRVQALEAKALDTKPIWERALAEILAVKERVLSIERKFDVLTLDMMQLRGDQRGLNARMDALESKPA
jgi:tetrahydromethanopterin S-methyltransferase subunit G